MKNTHFLVFILRFQAVRPLFFLLVWTGCIETSAQSGWQPFEKVIDYQDRVEAAASMTILDDTIYFYSKGWDQQDPSMLRKVVLNKCDLEGNLISQRLLFEADPYSYQPIYSNEILVTPDSNLMLIAAKTDGLSSKYAYDVFLAEISRNGDTVWTRQHGKRDTSEILYACQWAPDGDLFCIGYTNRALGFQDAYATLFSSDGERIWERRLIYNHINLFTNIVSISLQSKEFLITGGTLNPNSGFRGGRWLFDSSGAVMSMTYISGYESGVVRGYKDYGSGYVTLQSTSTVNPTYNPYMMRAYDTVWNEQWSLQLDDLNDDAGFVDLEVLPDSSYWICGWSYTDETPVSNYAQLVKVTKDGSAEWYRRYYLSTTTVNARLEYIRYHPPTNGVYGIGTTLRKNTSNNSDAWLLRFDSVGCIEAGCDTIVGQEFPLPLQPENLNVFPNPASGPMAVDIPPKLRELARELIIRNLAGLQVQSHALTGAPRKMVDVGSLPSGLYLAEVWGSEGLLGRVKFVRQ